jgi:4'-phosphopantetheinyl transferase
LNNGKHISISHSDDLAGIVISDLPIGIDIQGEDSKLLRIERKFTHETEREFLPNGLSRLASLALIWSAKEAVFKCFGERVDFSEDMQLRPFQPGDSALILDYQGEHGKGMFELERNRFGEINIVTTTMSVLHPHTV